MAAVGVPVYRETEELTLTDAIASLAAAGFRSTLRVRPGGRVTCESCGTEMPAEELHIERQERIEGASDPADEMLVAGVRCPTCSKRGTLVLAYGPRAGRDEADVLGRLPALDPRSLRRA
jgi:hypothetical protein